MRDVQGNWDRKRGPTGMEGPGEVNVFVWAQSVVSPVDESTSEARWLESKDGIASDG